MNQTKHSGRSGGKKPSRGSIGFYIALAVCLVTVAGAAWTTYGRIAREEPSEEEPVTVSDLQAAGDVSGESYEKSLPQEESAEQETSEENQTENSPSPEPFISTTVESSEEEKSVGFPVEDGTVLRPYSMTELKYSKTTADWRTHRGTDFAAKQGTAVKAMADGTVTAVEKDPLYGNIITIEHEGFTARYCGLSEKAVVRKGDHVKAGSPIGYIGVVPCEMLEETHLHLEILRDGQVSDPMTLLAAPPCG